MIILHLFGKSPKRNANQGQEKQTITALKRYGGKSRKHLFKYFYSEQKKKYLEDNVQIYSLETLAGVLETVTNLVLKCLSWW